MPNPMNFPSNLKSARLSSPPSPRFAVVFYRATKRARWFRCNSFDTAQAIADRFSERLEAVAFIHERPTTRTP